MWNPQKVRKLPTPDVWNAWRPTPNAVCPLSWYRCFWSASSSYHHFLFVCSSVISCIYSSTAHFMYLLSSCFIFYITFLMLICFVFPFIFLRIRSSVTTYFLALVFVSYFIFHDSAFSCWLLSFCHSMCLFLKFSCFMFVTFCPFNLPFASNISSYKLLHTIVSNLLLLSSTSCFCRSIVFLP
jgi:hypothetical protein